MAEDDIFDNVKAPSWAESLAKENENMENCDDSFFPEFPEVEEIALKVEQINIINDNPEDLSRMAMFGNQRQVKRRSQIRREEEAAKREPKNQTSTQPSNPAFRTPSMSRANSTSSLQNAPVSNRVTGPVTRSQTRSVVRQEQNSIRNTDTRGRSMTRNVSIIRSVQPSPLPTQKDFNRALNQRASSLGKGINMPHSTPTLNNSRIAAQNRPSRGLCPVPVPLPSSTNNNPDSCVVRIRTSSEIPAARAPISVSSSPRPTIAFGSAVKPKPAVPRNSVIRPRREALNTPTAKAPPLRSYPTPSGMTPAKGLTAPKTPSVMKRSSSITRNRVTAPVGQPEKLGATYRHLAKENSINRQNSSTVFDRLSKPRAYSSVHNASSVQTPKRIIPIGYTHGLNSAQKVRVRSRRYSKPDEA